MEVYEQLDLVTLKRKVAVPMLVYPQDDKRIIQAQAFIGNLVKSSSDQWQMYAYEALTFEKDGRKEEWQMGSFKENYLEGPTSDEWDWKERTNKMWAMNNRNRKVVTIRPDNVESETTVVLKG